MEGHGRALHPCPSCSRHVRVSCDACPFCTGRIAVVSLAIVAALASCDSDRIRTGPKYGAPRVDYDAMGGGIPIPDAGADAMK